MSLRIQCVCIDCHAPARIATFWEAALGWRRTYEDNDQVAVERPAGSPEDGVVPDLLSLRAPEDKSITNRLHVDLRPQVASDEVVVDLGAELVPTRETRRRQANADVEATCGDDIVRESIIGGRQRVGHCRSRHLLE